MSMNTVVLLSFIVTAWAGVLSPPHQESCQGPCFTEILKDPQALLSCSSIIDVTVTVTPTPTTITVSVPGVATLSTLTSTYTATVFGSETPGLRPRGIRSLTYGPSSTLAASPSKAPVWPTPCPSAVGDTPGTSYHPSLGFPSGGLWLPSSGQAQSWTSSSRAPSWLSSSQAPAWPVFCTGAAVASSVCSCLGVTVSNTITLPIPTVTTTVSTTITNPTTTTVTTTSTCSHFSISIASGDVYTGYFLSLVANPDGNEDGNNAVVPNDTSGNTFAVVSGDLEVLDGTYPGTTASLDSAYYGQLGISVDALVVFGAFGDSELECAIDSTGSITCDFPSNTSANHLLICSQNDLDYYLTLSFQADGGSISCIPVTLQAVCAADAGVGLGISGP